MHPSLNSLTSMFKNKKSKGDYGEDLAVNFLRKKGYKILERNFRTRFGEIDIVCEYRGEIVIVEVRAKSGAYFGSPEESITEQKKNKLKMMAHFFEQEKKIFYKNIRVDGVFIEFGEKNKIRHMENILA